MLLPGLQWFNLPQTRAVRLTGEDVIEWLQGQTTQDLRRLAIGDSIASAMASPTGQLEALLQIGRTENGCILITDCPEVVLNRVERLVIMEDVRAELLESPVSTIQGHRAAVLQEKDCTVMDDQIWLKNQRSPDGGWDVIGVTDVEPQGKWSDYEAITLEAGVPIFGPDTNPKTLPPELGPAFVERHISYTKGCYTGQEIIHRIHARGHVNKVWMGVRLEADVQPGLFDGGQGQLLRTAFSERLESWIGSAIVKSEFALDGSEVHRDGIVGTLTPMPLVRE